MNKLRVLVALMSTVISFPGYAQVRANDPATWGTSADGPFDPIGSGRTTLRIKLTISTEGKIVDCMPEFVQPPVKVPEKICSLISARARYKVAADKDGNPKAAADTLFYAVNRNAIIIYSDFGGAEPLSPEKWITNNDYPSEAQRQGLQGRVAFAVDITAAGKAAACRVVTSSGYALLDKITCALIERRARFSPPVDERGLPVEARGSGYFVWAIQR